MVEGWLSDSGAIFFSLGYILFSVGNEVITMVVTMVITMVVTWF